MKLKTVIAACAVAMLSLTSLASTYTWKSSVSEGDWATAENWESSDGGETYPSTTKDTAVFSDSATHVVTFSTAPTIAKLDLSAATGSITFKPAADKSRDDVTLTATTNAMPTTAGASVTLDGAALSVAKSMVIANGTTLSLLNEAYLTLSAASTASGMVLNYLGGKFIVRDSTFMGYGYCWGHADGLTIIDNSEFSLYRNLYWMQNAGGTIRFEGKNPKVRFRSTTESVSRGVDASRNAMEGVTAIWEFSIPEGGFIETPVLVDHTGGELGKDGKESSPLYIKVASDSPAKIAGETLQQQLISWYRKGASSPYRGIVQTIVKAQQSDLPQAADAFVWGDVPSGTAYPATLDVSLSGCYFKTSVRKTTSAWEGIDLTDFEASETASRPLYIAWGKADGGTTDAGWDHVEALGTVAASTEKISYEFATATEAMKTASATWGSDAYKAVRFKLVDGTTNRWSVVTEWYSLDAPVFDGALELNGDGCDTLHVSGKLASFAGDSCTLKVLVGTSDGNLKNVWENLDGSVLSAQAESLEFSFTLFTNDTASAYYFKPGETYYVAVEATANGLTTQSDVAAVTMATVTAATFGTLTWGASDYNSLTLAVTNKISALGTMDKTSVYLWISEDNKKTWTQTEPVEVTNTTDVAVFQNTFTEWGKKYCWRCLAVNWSEGHTVAATNLKDWVAYTPDDKRTYTWTGAGEDGAWTNAENWAASEEGGVGWPKTSGSTATFASSFATPLTLGATSAKVVFAANTTNTVSLDAAVSVGTLDLTATNANVTLVLADGATRDKATLTVATLSMNGSKGAGGTLTLDGVAVSSASKVNVASSGKLELLNAAKLTLSDTDTTAGYVNNYAGGQFILRGKSVYQGRGHRIGGVGGLTIVDDSELSLYRELYWYSTDGGTIRFEGKNPKVRFRKTDEAVVRGSAANLSSTWEFSIPEGGYDEIPVLCEHVAGQIGNTQLTAPLYIKVAADSPAKLASRKLTQRLISWYSEPGNAQRLGINTNVVKTLQENLPSKSDKFVWGEPASEDTFPTTLDVQFTNGPGLMLIIR